MPFIYPYTRGSTAVVTRREVQLCEKSVPSNGSFLQQVKVTQSRSMYLKASFLCLISFTHTPFSVSHPPPTAVIVGTKQVSRYGGDGGSNPPPGAHGGAYWKGCA